MSDEQVIVGVRGVVMASALLLGRLRDPEFLALSPTEADLPAIDMPPGEPRSVQPSPSTEGRESSNGTSRSARVRGLARRSGNLVRQQVHSGLERWSATRPGSEHWDGLSTEQRVAWWLATVGRTSAVTAALPGLAGYAGDRIPVADLISAAGQGLLLCAIAGEHDITDPDAQVRLVAEVLFDRRLDPTTAHLGDTTTARRQADQTAAEPDLAAPTVRARTLAAAKVLIRLGRSLRGLQDELDKRPQGHLGQRMIGAVPVVGIVGHYRGERRGLAHVAEQGQQWCQQHPTSTPPRADPRALPPGGSIEGTTAANPSDVEQRRGAGDTGLTHFARHTHRQTATPQTSTRPGIHRPIPPAAAAEGLPKSDVVALVREFGAARCVGGDQLHADRHTEGLWLYASGRARVGISVRGEEHDWTISMFAAPRVRMRPTLELYRYVARWRTTAKLAAPYVVEDGDWAAVMCEISYHRRQLLDSRAAEHLIRTTVDLVAQISENIAADLAGADGTEFIATGDIGAALLAAWWLITDPRIANLL